MIFEWHLICFEIQYQYPECYSQGSPQAIKLIILKILITFKQKDFLRCHWLGLTKTCNFVSGVTP